MVKYGKFILTVAVIGSLTLLTSCFKKDVSKTTGWEYNNEKNGGFEKPPFKETKTGPGLVLIEGGTFVMGRTEDNPMYDWNNIPRRVTVQTFYMDETEVSNLDYVEYLYWLHRVFYTDHPAVYRKALPDTLVWRDRLSYNEPLVEVYLRHPAYRNYPVVGVNWLQANDYCLWRTDRVNEMMLVKAGILDYDPAQRGDNNFNTEAYLAGQYEGIVNKNLKSYNPNGTGARRAKVEDGIMMPKYRLPTEAEWEYAALGLVGNTSDERIVERRIYPWNGSGLRTDNHKAYGDFVANFKRGRGDYMGVAGNLNDANDIPGEVDAYWPNDFGLYNMAGNVAEWVLDVYRPLSFQDIADLSPYRGNVFKTKATDADGVLEQKDSLGKIRWREVTPEESANRRNYRQADNKNYLDGDYPSTITNDWNAKPSNTNTTNYMYEYGINSLVSDKSRVYKGGSWKDRAYFLSPGSRRFLDEDLSADYIGFRCAMSRVGSPIVGKRK
ncbi:MAG: SUMF1/EgtB/PvdO family nonheme iron enzyme [Lentimicrobiaceae bacterium]|nr:SUMF1/EgtB/PvdO family nonheme iron enzyme [Lentimicrobiaceae bacterium]